MAEDSLTLYFDYPGYLDIPVGSWCDFYGKRYSLKKESNFKKNGERKFEYTLILETGTTDAMLWKVRDIERRIKFSYTAKPQEHLRLLVENLNRRGIGWKVGDYIEGAEKVINYNHTYILDALNQLADAYETEWQITEETVDGKQISTIHLRKVEYNKNNPLKLSYGKGHGFKVGVSREFGEIPPEIILVDTTDRNIDYSTYGAKNLLLPKDKSLVYEGHTYKTDTDGTYVMRADKELTTKKEESLDCTHIYPSRIGTVSSVLEINAENNFYDFIDADIPDTLNFEECLIAGESMTVIFQTGMLIGKEFEVKYIHKERDKKPGRRFEIVPQEIDGITMPERNVWRPRVGDTYAVFGIQLPNAYICDDSTQTGASWEVFKDAAKYLFEHEDKKFTFTGTLDGIWAKKRWMNIGGKIVLGGYVNFSDTQFHRDGSLIRIIRIKRYVNNPYSPEIELSNEPVGTSITSELNKIDTNEVTVENRHKDALQFTKRRFRDIKETMGMLEKAMLNFSGSINPITISTMQMIVGDESLQFRFVNSKANPVQVSHNITYNSNTKILNAPAGILQHMTLGINSVSSEHNAGEYKYWDMAEYNSPPLIETVKKYYLYAKVSKSSQTGTFLLSEDAIKLEQIDGYYHLLTGLLLTESEEERSFVELYGFTEVLPGRINTERIVSPDGETYFDLVKSEIGGNIKIKAGSSGLNNLKEWGEYSSEFSALSNQVSAQVTRVDSLTQRIDTAGWITTIEGNKIYASKELENGNTLISYINQDAVETTIHSSKINLEGAVTINALHSDLQTVINSKIDRDGLGKLAFEDAVEYAKLGTTIVVGGYLNTDLIKVRRIDADSGFIGGFTIESGRLVWTRSGYFGGTSRSLKLGSGTSKEGVVNVTFDAATDGRFGVSAIGSNFGGACIYASRNLNASDRSYPPGSTTYAGYFDGGVFVKGSLASELCLADNYGCITSKDADGTIHYYQGIDFDFGSNMKFRKGLLVSIA